jgi:hypothetical protein
MVTLAGGLAWMYSGGQGSGCHGPNCGRPTTARGRINQMMPRIRRSKAIPGVKRWKGRETIKLQPLRKSRVKQQFTSSQGHQMTIIKPPKQYDKSGRTWIYKKSPMKGQFKVEFNFKDDFKRNIKTGMATARVGTRGTTVAVHQDFGKKEATVIEFDLRSEVGHAKDVIARSRSVVFKNLGRAMGFLNQRYSIRLKHKA